MGYWIGGGILYVILIITLGVMSLRKGHWVMFIIGIFLPFFWLIGAIIPVRRCGSLAVDRWAGSMSNLRSSRWRRCSLRRHSRSPCLRSFSVTGPGEPGRWFLVGAMSATLAVGVLAAFVLGDNAASPESSPKTWVAILDIVVAVLLLVWVVPGSSAGPDLPDRRWTE